MRNNHYFGISSKGYYIALILCAAAIGISGYLYHQNATKAEEVALWEQQETLPVGTAAPAETEAAAAQTPKKATVPETTAPTQPVQKTLKTAAPVEGDEIYGYSMDALCYNETTRDWRVHNGVDFAAEAGAPVCAAADGTVYTTYEDDALGCTVVIRHAGGYTTHYSSLGRDLPVKAGDTVTMGQTIGYAADTALVETALGNHIHFSVTLQDTPLDPNEFFALS